jgi:hypothetical protein
MSTILKFPLERVQRRSFGSPDKTHNAEVLVFEGVRYENSQKPKSGTKRKKNTKRKVTVKS